jgi:predicted metal-dependent hydrolase
MNEVLSVADLRLQIRRSSRRKTLQITVERDGELIAAIPEQCDLARLEAFVLAKREWIYGKLALKKAQTPSRLPMQFQSGQGVYYLGRSHRILLTNELIAPLAMRNGRFYLRHATQERARQAFSDWLAGHGRIWLTDRLSLYAARFPVQATGLNVSDLGHRWGSCSKNGNLNFHWRVMQLPPSAIDYVLCHELAHLQEPNHTAAFWRLLEQVMPDYASRKDWLARHGGEYVL